MFRRAPSQQHVARSLHESPEKSFCNFRKVKPRMQWSPQDTGKAQTMRHLPRKAAYREWSKTMTEIYSAIGKSQGAGHLSPLNTGHGAAGFGVCPYGVQSCFDPVFARCVLTPSFWKAMCICDSVLEVCIL